MAKWTTKKVLFFVNEWPESLLFVFVSIFFFFSLANLTAICTRNNRRKSWESKKKRQRSRSGHKYFPWTHQTLTVYSDWFSSFIFLMANFSLVSKFRITEEYLDVDLGLLQGNAVIFDSFSSGNQTCQSWWHGDTRNQHGCILEAACSGDRVRNLNKVYVLIDFYPP